MNFENENKLGLLLKYIIAFALAVVILLTQNLITTQASTKHAQKMYEYEQELIQRDEVPKGYVKLNCGRIIKGELAPEHIQSMEELPKGYIRTTCGTVLKDPNIYY